MESPKASIVIRTKNEGKFLGKVLEILENQTYKNFEIVIVDSGSTDKTLEIVKRNKERLPRYARNDGLIRLYEIKPEEFGFSSTLNYGIEKAKGDLIVILSGHTLPGSDKWLENGVANFEEENVVGVYGWAIELAFGYYSDIFRKVVCGLAGLLPAKHKYAAMTNSNAMIRKSAWREYKFDKSLDKEGCEDYDWACEMIVREHDMVLDFKFSSIHSHLWLGRPGLFARMPGWKKTRARIDKKERG